MLWALLSWCGAGPAFAASAGQITVVPALGEPVAVAPGSDGNLWYADQSCLSGSVCGITRLTLSGRETEFPRNPPDGTGPIIEAVAPGPDGQVWFTDWGCTVGNGTCAIGRVTVSGKVTEFGRGLAGGLPPDQIAPGSDGAVWFIDSTNPGSGCCSPPGSIGRITPSGRISKYTRPGLDPVSITPGPDGDEWFADAGKTAIGKITPSGKITEYPLMAGEGACGIANGPDGNLWFTQPATVSASGTEETPSMIGKITPAGQITEYSSGLNQSAQPCDIATGADGNVWFADDGFATAAIGRVSPSGQITEYSSGLEGGGNAPDGTPLPPQPQSIVPGPDGNMWFAVGPCGDHLDSDCLLERIATGAPAPKRLQLRIAHAGLAAGGWLTLSGSYTARRPGLVRLTLERIAGERIQVVLRVTRFGWPGVTGFDIAAAGGRFHAGDYQLVAAASDSRQSATATFRMARSGTAQP